VDAPLVSVIIPARDAAETLGEAIDSVLAQRPRPFELWVVDDGSRDATAAVAEAYGEPVRCVSRGSAGPAAARNEGLRLARGELIAFLDADDLWPEGSLGHRLDALAADPTLDAVFGQVEEFVCPRLGAGIRAVARPPRAAPLPSALLVRRALFDRVGEFDPRWPVGEVIDWWARAQRAGMVARPVEAPVARRRLHGANQGVQLRGLHARTFAAILAEHRRAGADR